MTPLAHARGSDHRIGSQQGSIGISAQQLQILLDQLSYMPVIKVGRQSLASDVLPSTQCICSNCRRIVLRSAW